MLFPLLTPLLRPLVVAGVGSRPTGAAPTQVYAPSFSPAAGSYGPTQNVTISSATVGATIRYTTDGSTPTNISGTVYTVPVAVAATTTIKAIAYNGSLTDSAVSTGLFTINGTVATPAISPAAGTYNADQSVTITCGTASASIYYTIDGTTPDNTKTLYTGAFTLSASATVKAIGIKTGYTDSAVASNAIVLQVATPTFSPVAGTYGSTQNVVISSTTTGSTFYYTVDGSTPTTGSTLYSSAVAVAASETLKALGVKTGYSNSSVGSAAYVISAGGALPMTNLVHQYKLNTGLTQAGGFASAWNDQIGTAHLAQATGANQPAVQGDGSLLFDGVNDTMAVAFANPQPYTVFAKCKVVTWVADKGIIDGKPSSGYAGIIDTSGVSPQVRMYSGANVGPSNDLAVGTYGVLQGVFNGASSVFQVDANTPITGDAGATVSVGLALAVVSTIDWGNVQIKEILIYNAALDATQRAAVRSYLAGV
jgi:hypothetical protein